MQFEMPGARAVLEHLGRPTALELSIVTLERAVIENPGLAVDVAKTLVETTCKAICRERCVALAEGADLQKMVHVTAECLGLAPEGHKKAGELRRGLTRAASGLAAMVQGLAEVRNIEGTASHGKDIDWASIGQAQAELVAHAADTVVSFLYAAHLGQAAKPGVPPLRYEDNPDFNEDTDANSQAIEIFGMTYRPSEVLFALDLEAYRSELDNYNETMAMIESTMSEEGTSDDVQNNIAPPI
jgi:hypothetical protein